MHWTRGVRPLSVVLTLPLVIVACSDDKSPTSLDSFQGGPTLAAAGRKVVRICVRS